MPLLVSLKFASYVVAIVIIALFGVVVYRRGRQSATNRLFGLLAVVLVVWLVDLLLEQITFHYGVETVWFARGSIFWSVPQVVLILWTVITIPNKKFTLSPRWTAALSIIGFAMMLLTLTPYVFIDEYIVDGKRFTTTGPLAPLFGLYMNAMSLAILAVLWRRMRRSTGAEHSQLKTIFIGFLLMLGLLTTTLLLPVIFINKPLGLSFVPLYVLIFVGATAIAILRYQLFNIHWFATEAGVFVLNALLLIQLLISPNVSFFIFNLILFLFAGALSYLLVKAGQRELKQREELARLALVEEANIKLRELDRQKTEFLTIAAHQLRTPVSIIKNYLAMLQDGDYGILDGEVKVVLANIYASNQWLVRLADEFVNISYLEQGRTRYHFTWVNLGTLAEQVVSEYQARAEQKGLRLTVERTEAPAKVQADEDKLIHCLRNLLDNAIQYSEAGAITVSVKAEDNGVAVRVRDQGIGFASEDEPRLFQKFSRGTGAKALHVNTSAGLGLYVVRKFIEGHVGRVWAKSEGVGKGSEFGWWGPGVNGVRGEGR